MTPVDFPESNTTFGPPPDLEESQCQTIHAYHGTVPRGSVEGAGIVVTAWRPSAEELEALNAGAPVFLTCIGGLPPHLLSTSFKGATPICDE